MSNPIMYVCSSLLLSELSLLCRTNFARKHRLVSRFCCPVSVCLFVSFSSFSFFVSPLFLTILTVLLRPLFMQFNFTCCLLQSAALAALFLTFLFFLDRWNLYDHCTIGPVAVQRCLSAFENSDGCLKFCNAEEALFVSSAAVSSSAVFHPLLS